MKYIIILALAMVMQPSYSADWEICHKDNSPETSFGVLGGNGESVVIIETSNDNSGRFLKYDNWGIVEIATEARDELSKSKYYTEIVFSEEKLNILEKGELKKCDLLQGSISETLLPLSKSTQHTLVRNTAEYLRLNMKPEEQKKEVTVYGNVLNTINSITTFKPDGSQKENHVSQDIQGSEFEVYKAGKGTYIIKNGDDVWQSGNKLLHDYSERIKSDKSIRSSQITVNQNSNVLFILNSYGYHGGCYSIGSLDAIQIVRYDLNTNKGSEITFDLTQKDNQVAEQQGSNRQIEYIRSVQEKSGILFIGTDIGIYYFQGTGLNKLDLPEGFEDHTNFTFIEDDLYVASDNGLAKKADIMASIKSDIAVAPLKIYPNVIDNSTRSVNVIMPNLQDNSTINIYDINGMKLASAEDIQTSLDLFKLDLPQLTRGAYFVKLSSGNKEFSSQLIVKE